MVKRWLHWILLINLLVWLSLLYSFGHLLEKLLPHLVEAVIEHLHGKAFSRPSPTWVSHLLGPWLGWGRTPLWSDSRNPSLAGLSSGRTGSWRTLSASSSWMPCCRDRIRLLVRHTPGDLVVGHWESYWGLMVIHFHWGQMFDNWGLQNEDWWLRMEQWVLMIENWGWRIMDQGLCFTFCQPQAKGKAKAMPGRLYNHTINK